MSTSDIISLSGVIVTAIGVYISWARSRQKGESENNSFDYNARKDESVKSYFARVFSQLESDSKYDLSKLHEYSWLSFSSNVSWRKNEIKTLVVNGRTIYLSTNRNLKPKGNPNTDKTSAQYLIKEKLLHDLKK